MFECDKVPDEDLELYYSQQNLINDKMQKINELSVVVNKEMSQIAIDVDYIGPLPIDIQENGEIIEREMVQPQQPQQPPQPQQPRQKR